MILGLLGLYFSLSLVVFPSIYLSKEELKPQPFFDVQISSNSIKIGQSFDIHILSVGFPSLEKIDEQIKIQNYDFNHQYKIINKDTMLGAEYSAGIKKTASEYALIEIMNRPSPAKGHYTLDLSVTPKNLGIFEIYVKTIEIPHTSDLAHFPRQGLQDPQNEYVAVYSVMVNP